MFVGDYLIRREDKYTPIIGAAIFCFFLGYLVIILDCQMNGFIMVDLQILYYYIKKGLVCIPCNWNSFNVSDHLLV